jgi:hypothetical protein
MFKSKGRNPRFLIHHSAFIVHHYSFLPFSLSHQNYRTRVWSVKAGGRGSSRKRFGDIQPTKDGLLDALKRPGS